MNGPAGHTPAGFVEMPNRTNAVLAEPKPNLKARFTGFGKFIAH